MTEPNTPQRKSAPNARRQNRVAAMQFLYMYEANRPDDLRDALRLFFGNQEKPREYFQFAEELVSGAVEHLEIVDHTIQSNAQNWSFKRIAKVDLAILRLAIHELLHRNDIPPVVSINEAIDLSKEFSEPDAKRFINGILDRVKGTLTRPFRTAAGG